jgi:hypothetical protein
MTSQYGTYELHAAYARLRARTRKHTPSRPGTHKHARAHERKYVIFIAFAQQQTSQTRLSATLYVHWLSCFS